MLCQYKFNRLHIIMECSTMYVPHDCKEEYVITTVLESDSYYSTMFVCLVTKRSIRSNCYADQ